MWHGAKGFRQLKARFNQMPIPENKPLENKPLKNKVALVTGAARGLGRGIALVLAEQGAHIVVADRDTPENAAGTCAAIEAVGRRVRFIRADVSQETDVLQLFDSIESEFGRLDILVNNAGIDRVQDILDTSLEDWHAVLDVNLTGCFLCAKAALGIMRKQETGGRIVNISSITGQQGALYGRVHYGASKAGLLGLTKTLARSAAQYGVTVNAIAPGIIETDLLYETHGAQGVEKLAASVPLGLGTPRDVGLAVAFFCGEGGRYITGATLDVNGGMYFR
jgi:NAD(P)-dependent dehydrogenase (short-subunit alcohol dehydrogenase family)